jgi:integrase
VDVLKVLAVVPPMVRAMAEVQWLSGCRPQDVVQMRACDLDRSGPVWEYRPPRHKTQHHDEDGTSDRDRVVYIGPKAQAVLDPLLSLDPTAYVFVPFKLQTPTRYSARKKSGGREKAPLLPHYPVASYRQAIKRGCRRAGVPDWVPNRLRHSRLTYLRKLYGLEASRVCGGHREVGVTQHYAEQDRDLARRVMAEAG